MATRRELPADFASALDRFPAARDRFAARPVALANGSLATANVRAWGSGTEAVVTNFDDLAAERFGNADVAEVAPMSLEEIFIAVAGEEA